MERTSSDESVLIVDQSKPGSGHKCYRPLALFFMCFLGFGSYFCYDNPSALQATITKDLNLTTSDFSYLYSMYSWPNTVLCFIGGFLIDRVFGIRFGTSLYALIVFLGQIVVACGALFDSFRVMLLGRFIFGIGGESLAVAQNYYAVLWFKGKELNMVFGLQLSIARVGSAVNMMVMGPLYQAILPHFPQERTALGVTLLLASGFCLISFVCGVVLAILDAKGRVVVEETNESSIEPKKVVRLTDALYFSPAFWMVSIICVTYYIAIFPFIALGQVFFMRKFALTSGEANFLNGLIYIIAAIASPLLGYVVDRTGWNVLWVCLATVGTIAAHAILAFTFWNPYCAVVLLGIAYSMCAAALWPMISLVTPEYQLGTAYGVAQALQNLGLAVSINMAGMVVDSGGYLLLEIFFLCWLFVALITCLVMWIYDTRTTGILNMTVAQRDMHNLLFNSAPSMSDPLVIDDNILNAAADYLNELQEGQPERTLPGDVEIPPHAMRSKR